MQRLKQAVRRTLAAALFYTGLLHLYARFALRGRIVVLTYHRVLPPERLRNSFSARAIVVSPAVFAMHMECVSRWLRPLTQAEFVTHSASAAAPPARSCLVTFDDGWYDNHEYALPILRKYRVPMTLFVATDYIDSNRCFWQERLAALLFATRGQPAAQQLLSELGAEHLAPLADAEAREAALEIIARIKAQRRDPEALIEQLTALPSSAATSAEDRFMTLAQLRALHESGWVSIASHAMSHARLNLLPDERIAAELTGSSEVISRWFGGRPATCAYPNGDYDDRVVGAARASGYVAAFTTRAGHFKHGDDRHTIRRVNIHEGIAPTKPLFMMRLLGLL